MKGIKLFLWVVLCQIFILNNIQYSGYINPYYYIIFILAMQQSRVSSLLLSFMLGLTIDFFSESHGIHTFACVLITYMKPFLFNSTNHISEDINIMRFDVFFMRTILIVLIHHLTLFLLEDFELRNILSIIFKTLISAFFTMILLIVHKAMISIKNEI